MKEANVNREGRKAGGEMHRSLTESKSEREEQGSKREETRNRRWGRKSN